MMVQAQEEMGEGSANPTDPHHTPTLLQPSPSQQQKTQKHRKPRRKVTKVPQPSDPLEHVADKAVNVEMDDSLVGAATIASNGGLRCQETMGDTIAQTRVLNLENTKTTQALEIDSLKRRVKKLKKKQRLRTHKLKRLYKVGLTTRVESSDDDEDLGEDESKQRRISDIYADEDITFVSTHGDA
nr:hypothetical protein [Tanacetum cinerariifolium]